MLDPACRESIAAWSDKRPVVCILGPLQDPLSDQLSLLIAQRLLTGARRRHGLIGILRRQSIPDGAALEDHPARWPQFRRDC